MDVPVSRRSQGDIVGRVSFGHHVDEVEEDDDMHFSPFMQMESYNRLRFAPQEEGMKAHLAEEEDSSVDGSESISKEEEDYQHF